MSDVIDVTISDAEFDVYWQDEVELNLDMALMYIKSGEAEIQKYVETVSKPEINEYVKTQAKPLVTQVVNEIAEPTVAEYIETTVKPEIDEYVEDKKPELQAYVTQASGYVDNSQASAEASAASAAASLTSANNAKTSETNAKTYENNALSSKNAAASSATSASNYANNSKIWAEGTDAQVQALGGEKSAKGWVNSINGNNLVYKTGDQAVTGRKTFVQSTIFNKECWIVDTTGTATDNPPSQPTAYGTIRWIVKGEEGSTAGFGGGQELFRIQPIIDTLGRFAVYFSYSYISPISNILTFGCNADGSNVYVTVPTPATADNSTSAATTAFVNNKFKVVSTLPASPDANVFYFIPE